MLTVRIRRAGSALPLPALVGFSLAFCFAQPAQAQVLTIDDSNNNLGTVDISTGAVTTIGSLGSDLITDLAYSPTGTLYGTSFKNLYQIDSTTGQTTLIGPTGLKGGNALVFGSDGTLYLATNNTKQLYTVNTSTGTATSLGNIGFAAAGDLAFNGGSLYMSSSTNRLIRINLSGTVSGTDVGPFGFGSVFGLATAADGVLYGVSGTKIFSVDTTTGAGTLVRDYGGQGLTLAFGTSFVTEAIPADVPEPSSVALLVASTLAAGFLVRRRRKVQTTR